MKNPIKLVFFSKIYLNISSDHCTVCMRPSGEKSIYTGEAKRLQSVSHTHTSVNVIVKHCRFAKIQMFVDFCNGFLDKYGILQVAHHPVYSQPCSCAYSRSTVI